MPIRYIHYIREILRQYYRKVTYKCEIIKTRNQFIERLEKLDKEIKKLETDIIKYRRTENYEIVAIGINHYKNILISERSRLIETLEEIDSDIIWSNNRLRYQTKLSKKYLNLNHLG